LVKGDWIQQLYALDAVQSGAASKEVAQFFAQRSPDPLIRQAAAATLEIMATPGAQRDAATQPATQPAATTPAPPAPPRPPAPAPAR
jgi:hypothetical protein